VCPYARRSGFCSNFLLFIVLILQVMRSVLFTALVFLAISGDSRAFVQDTLKASSATVHPYVGLSINFAGFWGGQGIGAEAGCQYGFFFAGLEYGICGAQVITTTQGVLFVNDLNPYDQLVNVLHYFGFHIGINLNKLWLGADFLWNYAAIDHSTYDNSKGYFTDQYYSLTIFDAGPDARLNLTQHSVWGLAYSMRRGVKCGVAYLF